MTTDNKIVLGIVGVLAVLGALAFFDLSPYRTVATLGASAVGSTYNTAKSASIVFSPTTGATTTSLYNGDATDRYITSTYAACGTMGYSYTPVTGTGLTSLGLIFTAATTSTKAPATLSALNTNYVFNAPVPTTTADAFLMGTSTGATSAYLTRWASGTYLTFSANATNTTAVCTVGANYIGS